MFTTNHLVAPAYLHWWFYFALCFLPWYITAHLTLPSILLRILSFANQLHLAINLLRKLQMYVNSLPCNVFTARRVYGKRSLALTWPVPPSDGNPG